MSSRNIITIVVVVVALALGFGYILGTSQTVRAPDNDETMIPFTVPDIPIIEAAEGEGEATRTYITREMIETMYYGLAYEDVEELFGVPSDESETEYDQGVEGYTSPFVIHWHVWKNEDGSQVRLGFINNKMDRKHYTAPDGAEQLPESPHTDVDNYGRVLGIEE